MQQSKTLVEIVFSMSCMPIEATTETAYTVVFERRVREVELLQLVRKTNSVVNLSVHQDDGLIPVLGLQKYWTQELALLKSECHAIMDKYSGHAIAEAVSRWLPTAAAQVQSRVWSSGICGGQSGAGAGFL
jgi:hypothetical protein